MAKAIVSQKIMTWSSIYLILAGLALLAVACSANRAQTNATSGSPATNSGTRLADTPQWKYAHLISEDSLDPAAQEAISGFTLQKSKLPDGNLQIKLIAKEQGYKDQSYTLQPGQQLFFIEKFMGDDTDGREFNIGDDTAVIVDSNGHIVNS
jgi:hypothetical protein